MDRSAVRRSRSLRSSALAVIAIAGTAVVGAAGPAAAAPTPTGPPVYQRDFQDCVTGDNAFSTSDGLHHWYINQMPEVGSTTVPGVRCDSYQHDQYERPTDQTFVYRRVGDKTPSPVPDRSGLPIDSEIAEGQTAYATDSGLYFEYLDITRARAGHDSSLLYFQIELFGVDQVESNGKAVEKFAEGTYYTVRLGTHDNPDKANGGIALRNQFSSNVTTSWSADPSQAKIFRDTNGDASGTAGRNATKVDGDVIGSNDGFDQDVANNKWLYVRRVTTTFTGPGGVTVNRPAVEFAFDYAGYNAATAGADITPQNIRYLEFDSTRGLKDNQNYLWNDEYTLNEAGSPNPHHNGSNSGNLGQAGTSGTGNIYQLDTLRGGGFGSTPQPPPPPPPFECPKDDDWTDRNGDGKMSADECAPPTNPPAECDDDVWTDRNGDGKVTPNECTPPGPPPFECDDDDVWTDLDGDGVMTSNECTPPSSPPAKCAEGDVWTDHNGDGKVSAGECAPPAPPSPPGGVTPPPSGGNPPPAGGTPPAPPNATLALTATAPTCPDGSTMADKNGDGALTDVDCTTLAVLSSTLEAPASGAAVAPSADRRTQVQGVQARRTSPSALARTGWALSFLAVIGAALVTVGVVMSRRRRAIEVEPADAAVA